ncbi:type II CRISPR-associated endonuclease Cas1 [Lacticaseibacillus nasuensis]|uniref:type II CRISPR-associated endonuclease Cas1 n=1 Tax=Lacticaseibacillus nasuensis TaxID=944671 RepID=UPI002246060F|nr:type II CRISPR-associated endonuclease Cas1 [Lacticaseibacillus nasuensis]MCX2455099.1 type II CRISPR-associated endonuclease Cas1 [Lacticaseibacillus nasuensis]
MYITQHAKVSTLSRQLVIQTNYDTLQVPIEDIQLLMFGTPQIVITGAAVAALAEVKAKIIYTGMGGQVVAETVGLHNGSRTQQTISQQVQWPASRIANAWTRIVDAKLANQAQVLVYHDVPSASVEEQREMLELNDPTNREAVAARKYFPLLFGKTFSRSDLCATNAALNYGYAILLAEFNREIVANGYLPEWGIHHHSNENPFNLGSDFMEPFRPIIDHWVASQKIKELTPDIKIGLVTLLDIELNFNNQQTILRNAVADLVASCIRYLNQATNELTIKVVVPSEVSSHALNDHV